MNRNDFKVVELIFNKCKKIEKSGNLTEYDSILSLIYDSFSIGNDIRKTVSEYLTVKGVNAMNYQYIIGTVLEKVHSKTPEYKGRNKRIELIKDFINKRC